MAGGHREGLVGAVEEELEGEGQGGEEKGGVFGGGGGWMRG